MVRTCKRAPSMAEGDSLSRKRCSNSAADSSMPLTKMIKSKRKSDQNELPSSRPLKSATREKVCSSEREEVDHGLQWRNLELCLTIEGSKEDSPSRKVELVHNYINAVAAEEKHDVDEAQQAENVSLSRLIVRLSTWVQSLLISSEDKMRTRDKMLKLQDSNLCLDSRCWEILRYCLQESAKLGVSLSLSGNLLRVISYAARNAVHFLNDMSLHLEEYLELERFKFYRTVYDCIGSMFSLHNGALKGSMDSWMAAVGSVLELATYIFAKKMESTKAGSFFIDLSCSVLEPFSKFLRVQRWRKNGFRDFVDNLLEPLFHLLGLLHDQSNCNNTQNLSDLIEDIISCGLFHPSHMDEFLKLQGLGKYSSSSGEGLKELKIEIRSYQRHLFEKLQDIVSQKKEWALSGTGQLLQLFVKQVKKQKMELLTVEGFRHMEGKSTNHMSLGPSMQSGVASENNNKSNSSTRKSIFDFLVQIMEPLLLEIKLYVQSDLAMETSLVNAQSILRSLNLMLYGIISEKIYVRTEDISEGACINFFKVIYDLIISFSAKVIRLLLSSCDSNEIEQKGHLSVIAEELVVAVGYILEVEHKVIGEGLVDLWLMILAFLAAGKHYNKKSEVCPLISRTVVLSCQVVNLFKELREASHAVFALCRGLRNLFFSEREDETNFSPIMSVSLLHNEIISKSAELLTHSQKFRINVQEALKSIPEGQASDCVQTLIDISKSLDWTKVGFSTTMKMEPEGSSHRFSMHAELLGKVFSEIYVLVLDSVPITAGNSCRVGDVLNEIIMFIKPIMSGLIASAQYRTDGRILPLMQSTSRINMPDACHWMFLFLFRLYVSCRSLFREVITLLPPRSSLKKSSVLGDGFTGYSGMDWMKSDSFRKEGYMSCLSQSSTSLLVFVQSIRQSIDKASSADYSSLIYMLHPMIIQRLVDLNRQMNLVQYLMQENSSISFGKRMADDGVAPFEKGKNWKLILSDLEEEASKLTAFMIESLSVLDQEERLIARSGEEASNVSSQPLNQSWDMCVCSLDEKTLQTAVWWIVCQNVDVWCRHATDEDSEIFLSMLNRSALCFGFSSKETVSDCTVDSTDVVKVSMQQISLGLLQDTSFYELPFVRRHLASSICHTLPKFDSFPEWGKLLSTQKISYIGEEKGTVSFLDNDTMEEFFKGGGLFPLTCFQFTVCRNFINLLIHMPKQSLSTESFMLCTRLVLNLERVIVRCFMETHETLQLRGELFRLLVCCRRALKCLLIASSEEKIKGEESCGMGLFGESPSQALWLLKSAALVVEKVSNCPNNGNVHTNSMIFSLLDHTSGMFTTLAKYYDNISVEVHKSGLDCKKKALNNSIESVNACRTTNMIAKLLRDQLNDTVKSENTEGSFRLIKLNKISSLLSCIQGFLWGLTATLNDVDAGNCRLSVKASGECENISVINQCIETASEFMDSTFKKFLGKVDGNSRFLRSILSSYDRNNSEHLDSKTGKVLLILPEFDLASERGIWKNLQELSGHQNLDYLLFIRELFIASSAILRLRIRTTRLPLPSSLMKFLLGMLQETLLEFANMDQMPKEFWFVLDGALQFMEVLGHQYASSYLTMSNNVLVELVILHFKAIGKCISLQQKIAKLASHEMEPSTKPLSSQLEGFAGYGVEELKTRLRTSFKMLIKNSSHLGSVIQSLERALVGVHEGCTMIYDITIGKDNGGIVSSTVAAGIDCLDLVLECVEGRQPVKEKLQSLTASLFNILVHLQGPSVFYNNLFLNEKDNPDSGSVVLMCVEVLTRISRKDTLFQIDVGHQSERKQKIDVGQFLRLPAAIFQNFGHLTAKSSDAHLVDEQFSIDLYASCCRLLCTVVKHRHSECVKKTGLLQYSIEGLLNCLEMVDTDSVDTNSYFSWTLEEGIKCACYLRRVYEEIRQQKLFQQHCFKLLSNYISVYSGFGPLKKGIKREIDEAMRPGVYALIDACSEKNLQCLHTEFGEGPCRSILASLRHDYKLHFQYHGKV